MKRNIFTFLAITLCGVYLHAGSLNADTLVRVYGKLLSQKDSSAVRGMMLYEKLPYYDDMGMVQSGADGSFECYLVKNTKYNMRVDNLNGFDPWVEEYIVIDEDGDLEVNMDFYIPATEEEELIRLDNLTFARGSPTIQASSFPSLNEFIEYINDRPDVNIQLEGHTDISGNSDANMALSQARVDAVAEYLTKNGVKKNRITTKAFGGSQPLSTERTDEARALNRRVEVRLIRQ